MLALLLLLAAVPLVADRRDTLNLLFLVYLALLAELAFAVLRSERTSCSP